MTREEAADALEKHARELADMEDRTEDAVAAYRVAADLRDELGYTYHAAMDRTGARRLLVAEWARERWPDEMIIWEVVFPLLPSGGRRHGRLESWTFRVIGLTREGLDVRVRIDRHDRVRLLRSKT